MAQTVCTVCGVKLCAPGRSCGGVAGYRRDFPDEWPEQLSSMPWHNSAGARVPRTLPSVVVASSRAGL